MGLSPNHRSEALQRLGPVADVPALLEKLGVDPELAFQGLEVGREDFAFDRQIAYASVLDILERSVVATGCQHFGLMLGAGHDHRSLGILGRLMSHGSSIREALTDFVDWQFGYSKAATVYLQRIGSDYALGYGIYGRHTVGTVQIHDLVIAVGCNFVRALSGGRVSPVEVHLSHRQPVDTRPYDELLRVPVLFNQPQSCLVLTEAAMKAPVRGADPLERARILATLGAATRREHSDAAGRLRHALWPQLLLGRESMPDVARRLELNTRTMRRQLAREGVTFAEVKDDIRFTAARDLLELTDLPIGDIAAALSYSTHSAFDLAYRRWSGMSPSEWRRSAVYS